MEPPIHLILRGSLFPPLSPHPGHFHFVAAEKGAILNQSPLSLFSLLSPVIISLVNCFSLPQFTITSSQHKRVAPSCDGDWPAEQRSSTSAQKQELARRAAGPPASPRQVRARTETNSETTLNKGICPVLGFCLMINCFKMCFWKFFSQKLTKMK